MAVTAAGGNLAPLLLKLMNLSSDQVSELDPHSSRINSVVKYLTTTKGRLLSPAAENSHSPQLQLWKNSVRELAYSLEDAIDEYSVLRAPNNSTGSPGDLERVICTIQGCSKHILELPHKYGGIEEIELPTGSTGDSSTSGNTQENLPALRETGRGFIDPASLVGIDTSSELIIRLLEEEHRVVSIVGLGGLGKTTLAKHVFDRMEGRFDCSVFVSVSRNPVMKDVMNSILRALGSNEASNEVEALALVSQHVRGKRYLVVLDDVWEKNHWRTLKAALWNDNHDSRVIVTTRNREVAEESQSYGSTYEMRGLCRSDAEKLFLLRALPNEEECPPRLRGAFDKFLKRCDGSPLAILVLSGLVATKVTPQQWDEVADYFGAAVPEDSDVVSMRNILSLSYFDLPHHLRTCLLYLSIFPEDSEISRKVLVNRWIAEGFITELGHESKTAAGERYFHELISRNLIQPVKIKYDGRPSSCRVHDTILDFIMLKSDEDKFVMVGQSSEFRHLSIHHIPYVANPEVFRVPQHARSLTVYGFFYRGQMVFSLESTALRVLDLGNCHVIEYPVYDIEKLFHIRYLDPGPISVDKLPQDFGKLQQLETLELRGMDEDVPLTLPVTINQLERLVRLWVNPNVRLPNQIERMRSLEKFKTVNLDYCSADLFQQLGLLTNLKVLGIRVDTTSEAGDSLEVLLLSLSQLGQEKLHTLYINFNNVSPLEFPGPNDLLWKRALENLQKLSLTGTYIPVVPVWMDSCKRLQKLNISAQDMSQEQVDILGRMESLLDLVLGFEPFDGNLSFNGRYAFKILRYFGICTSLAHMWRLRVEVRSMPKLELFKLRLSTDARNYAIDAFEFEISDTPRVATVDVLIQSFDRTHTVVREVKTAIMDAARRLTHLPHAILKIKTISQTGNDYEEVECGIDAEEVVSGIVPMEIDG